MKKTTAEKPSSKKPAAKAAKKAAKPAAKTVKRAEKPAAKAAKKAEKPVAKAAKKAAKPAAEAAKKVKKPALPAVMLAPEGSGERVDPWVLTTPGGGSEYQAYCDETLDTPALVVIVGKTELRYDLRCLDDLHAMLRSRGGWVPLGSADEQKPAAEGTVEAWARSPKNPVGGFYGLKKGLRGRFASYVPPVLERLGRAEVEHSAREGRMRAL